MFFSIVNKSFYLSNHHSINGLIYLKNKPNFDSEEVMLASYMRKIRMPSRKFSGVFYQETFTLTEKL